MQKIHLKENKILKLSNVLFSVCEINSEDLSIDVQLEQMQSYIRENRIDGVDIHEMENASLRKAISYVPQNIELFSKSIYDNIRISRQNATLEEVREAAKAADAHEFIKRLPMQYDTYLEDAGNGLSGGEKL